MYPFNNAKIEISLNTRIPGVSIIPDNTVIGLSKNVEIEKCFDINDFFDKYGNNPIVSLYVDNWERDPMIDFFRIQMEQIVEQYHDDEEAAHSEMDKLMCSMLKTLGFGAGVKIFEDAVTWCA